MGKGKYEEALFPCSSLKKGSVPGNYLEINRIFQLITVIWDCH